MPTAQAKNVMENLGILSLNCTADLLNELCFKSPKSQESKDALNGLRFVEDFTPNDFETRKKAVPIMKQAFEDGEKSKIYQRETIY